MDTRNIFNSAFVLNQVQHWLATPANGYLGSDYGTDIQSYLFRPMDSFEGDEIIAKMKQDIPILQGASEGLINIFFESKGIDEKVLYIQIADNVISKIIR